MGVGNDKATRKMEADELIESLVAQTTFAVDDLAIPVEESQPVKRPARHANGIPPITKPPAMREVSRPPAPIARHQGIVVLLFALVAVALAEVALRMLT